MQEAVPASPITFEQELLLRAALCPGDEAVRSWRRWKERVTPGSIDQGSTRLLPLLYNNLKLNGVAELAMEELCQHYLQTWSNNEVLLHELVTLLRLFHESRIETLLLKGAPLALLFYKDLGLRPMSDVDVLVRPEKVLSAIEILHREGWKSVYQSPATLIPYQHALEFTGDGGYKLDLHWRALWDGRQGISDDDFWDSAVAMEIDGVRTSTLNPADQLLHVCVHGAAWNSLPPLRWIADSAHIIRVAQAAIDWEQLVKRTRERRLMLPVRDALGYLQAFLGAPIPPDVIKALRNIPASKLESTLYRTRVGKSRRLRRLNVLYYWYCAWRRTQDSYPRRFFDFLRYVTCFCGHKFSFASRGRR